MKLSQFNVLASKPGEDQTLLYNTFSDSQIMCDKNYLNELFVKIKKQSPLEQDDLSIAHDLKEMGFLIDDEVNEKEKFLNWFDTKVRNNYERLSTLLLTSRTCNLRCPYCFEKDVLDQGLNMTEETARQYIKWLTAKIDKHHPQVVDITFFGGEPLMNQPVIRLIAKAIHDHCQKADVEFEFGMVTNGVMLTPKVVQTLKPWGFKWAKITLDGDKCDHDKLRITKSGKGTFDKIWHNLEQIKGMLPLYIGGNFDSRNQKSLQNLIDKLNDSVFRQNLFGVEFKPIQLMRDEQSQQKESCGSDCSCDGDSQDSAEILTSCAAPAFDDAQIETMMATRQYLFDKDMPTPTQVGIGPCELHRKSHFGVDMDGYLYKCSGMVGNKAFASGNIWEGQDDVKVIERMGEGIRPWKDCGACPFIPVCAGGCKFVGYNQTGDFAVGSCDKQFFKSMVNEMFEKNLEGEMSYHDGLQLEKAEINTELTSFSPDHDDFTEITDEEPIQIQNTSFSV